jgi:RimJ/RimL family protein N-acetyltransferase
MIVRCNAVAPSMVSTTLFPGQAEETGAVTSVPRARDWRRGLPTLEGSLVHLREFRPSDARTMWAAMSRNEASPYDLPAPITVEGFEKFIAWTHRQRASGQQACFAVIPRKLGVAVGVIQLRALVPDFSIAEWGFALGSEYHGTGMFRNGARLAVDFAIRVLGARRLEAKTVVQNACANAALRRLGAVQEAVVRCSVFNNGKYFDQALWAIHAGEWDHTRTD